MSSSELKGWFSFIQEAPESIRQYLEGTLWLLVFLILVWAILKIIFNNQFKELYRILSISAKKVGGISKTVAQEAAKNLELPEPYPKLTRFFAVIFMLNTYAAFFLFSSFFLVFTILLVMSDTVSFWGRTGGMLFSITIGYFAFFCFAQAERDRVALFRRNNENS